MSAEARDSPAGGRSIAAGSSPLVLRQQQQRVRGLAAGGVAGEESLDLLSNKCWSVSVAAGEESEGQNVPQNLARISVRPAKLVRTGMDDLLSGADMGKHDYDWLLTPPGSPLSSPDTRETHPSSIAPRSNPSARSVSTTRASRFSTAQLENNHSTRPARSSSVTSVTRPSISTTYSSRHISGNSNKTSLLNVSTTSITSLRPSIPSNHSTLVPSTRQSASMVTRSATSQSSTPSRTRPTSSTPGHSSRPSTPTSRSQNSACVNSNSSSTVVRSSSRPSTPARRAPVQTSAPLATFSSTSSSTVVRSSSRPSTATRRAPVQTSGPLATLSSTSSSSIARLSSRPSTPARRAPAQTSASLATRSLPVGENLATSSRNAGPASRPGSPGPRVRTPSQPLVLPDFPLDVPPNLRTKIPERPASADRARPGLPLRVRANLNPEAVSPMNSNGRRPSSPVATRGRHPNNSPKLRPQSNGHEVSPPEIQKPIQQENAVRRAVKTTTTMESTGFGRTISKTSLDMALRHMDIRQSMGGVRGASLFPQSIRSAVPKARPARMSDPVVPISSNGTDTDDNSCNGMISTSCSSAASENGDTDVKSPGKTIFIGRASDPDIYESSRYDAILLKEDSRNLNWLHSIDDKSDQSPVFDHSFEPLPEPFVLL